ncbi:prepilin peptidase [Natranaerofaba carboxydovora]|uniref:prepilin peptidase n=1 Tax=Natranaerofaba carboxydovora TaxID=2742683 RepID=UPI001F13F03B|nr:A24 family peptidase [Natranaerofaba carboxydovora]UMZ73501.1 Type 4 prepilin-like proteins leader peptide-processing enzyme [Natranaerofaba carboxydovora]
MGFIDFYIFFIVFLLGIVVGSFLNVCIYRIPRNETVVYNSSSCTECETKLKPFDLIPVFSYLFLKGKCRYCSSQITPRYPLVEALTGIIFVISYVYFGIGLLLIKYLFIFSILIVISFIDIDNRIIPNKLVLILLVWAIIWQIIYPEISLYDGGLGAVIGGGLFFFIAVISRGGMGGGDIKLMFAAGFLLGGALTALTILIASIIGSIVGVTLMALKLKDRKDPIPFGPFICLGIFMSVIFGDQLLNLYLEYLLV